MTITYQQAQPEDIPKIFSLNHSLICQYEDLTSINLPSVLNWVQRKLESSIGEYTRILLDGEVAGYYHFAPCGEKMELDDLYILPPFQGQGIGVQVVKRCLAKSDVPVFLYVFSANTGAAALYRRLGFQITQEVGKTRYIMEHSGAQPLL